MRRGLQVGVWRVAVMAICSMAATTPAAALRKLFRFDAQTRNQLREDGWRAFGKGFARDGGAFVCDNGADAKSKRGVSQFVTLNQQTPEPIVACAWSKAENVTGGTDSDYSLYLDLTYSDGDHLWGQIASFAVGTHDWERREVRITPQKPVKEVGFNLLLRGHAGKAWFRGAELHQQTMPPGTALFDGNLVTSPSAGPAAGTSVMMARDVAADSDYVAFENGQALGVKLDWKRASSGSATLHTVRIVDTTGKDRAISLVYAMRVPGERWDWLADVRREEPAISPREYRQLVDRGRLSHYPWAAVRVNGGVKAGEPTGRAIALDMSKPGCFHVGFSAATGELYIAFDIGLAAERNSAEVGFCTLDFDGAFGFRGAVKRMYEIFPEQFRCRTPDQGIWMPFSKISSVQGWEDFGFKFKEGDNEPAWDAAHGIVAFRYTEPLTWWMSMPKGMPRTMDAAAAEARRLAAAGKKEAQAWLTSAYHDENGHCIARLEDTPWCNGAVWSMNSSPDVSGAATDFKNKWNPQILERLYGGKTAALAGEYVDSSEGYVTNDLDFRRDHFPAARTALTFDSRSHRVAAYTGLVVYEYVRAIAEDLHPRGKLTMANGTPGRLCWLAPYLDVMGTETNWNHGDRWQPMRDEDLMFRRALCGPKPYCFLMNTAFEKFTPAMVEKYMKRCLAYGMFPGFFSHNASDAAYFTQKSLYDRDRPLFKKYVPLCKRVAEAGWEPITRASSSDPRVYVERFGKRYLTVFNDSAEKKSVTITLTGPAAGRAVNLVNGKPVDWQSGKARLELEAEDVAVVDLGAP